MSELGRAARAMTAGTLLLAATGAEAAGGGFTLTLVERVGGLDRPTALAAPADGSGRLFVAEKGGRIRVVVGDTLLPEPFLDLSAIVLDEQFERGLVGLAFHPDYARNGRFFVAYADLAGDAAVASYLVSANPEIADPKSGEVILVVPQPSPIHNVNQLAFGPDGYLYIASGDGGPANDPAQNAQNLALLLGKILRIDVDAAAPPLPYAIPPDNPFVGDPVARAEIWHFGLRNPSRFSFDRATGDLWIADVGQYRREEIDLQLAGDPGGRNFGWSRMEGSLCFDPREDCDDGTLTAPVLEYPHLAGNCAVMGGHRSRGAGQPRLSGIYLFADWCSGRIWGATPRCGGGFGADELYDAPFRIAAFAEEENGDLVVAEWTTATARLFRVVALAAPQLFQDGFEFGDAAAWSACDLGGAERASASAAGPAGAR